MIHPSIFISMSFSDTVSVFFFFIFTIVIPCFLCNDDTQYTECGTTYDCGLLLNIAYPFWAAENRPRHCGLESYELTCKQNQHPLMRIHDQDFVVLNISRQNYTMRMARLDLWQDPCTRKLDDTALDSDLFTYAHTVRNLTLYYGCLPQDRSVPNNFTCEIDGTDKNISYYVDDSLSRLPHQNRNSCYANVTVPILWSGYDVMPPENKTADVLKQVLKEGFQVEYKADWDLCRACMDSDGACGSNTSSDAFICFCPDGPHDRVCPNKKGSSWNWKRKVVVGAFSVAGAWIMVCVIVLCVKIRIKVSGRKNNDQNLEAFIRDNGPPAVKRYKFSEIRKMTKSFKDILGQGGYGDVYKGKLLDGCLVAVKVLKESKGNGEDFINEVASISRTSHVNIVTLLGYCFEGYKKALIYEFMPNGSLEKFIYKSKYSEINPGLKVEKLFEIAIGIARGLEYLHRGCNTRILHFDIKPHNMLLDEDFCPKISDFGLSKLCLKKESIISMLHARGTIGYIAPEVFCRNFGGVSVKSDVYSFGMMILEMVGGRRNIDAEVSQTSEIYFPDWIYNHLEPGSSLGSSSKSMNEEENEVARKMIIVGLWCIQTKPADRPCMSKAIEMLEGNIEALQIPPKPVLTSPTRTPPPEESSNFSLTC